MKGSDFIWISVFTFISTFRLSDAFSRSRNKQTDVGNDDALLHYVAECPVNYVIELGPITTGRSHALVECERALWKVVYEHCQGQQTCVVSLPWLDMLKHKVECLNEIENYRPFHYQCRSFSESGPLKDDKGLGLVSTLYEMVRKTLSHPEQVEGRQGVGSPGPKTAKASSSRRVSMTSYRSSPSGNSRSSVRMSSSRRVSTSWNSWNGPAGNAWTSWTGGNDIEENVPGNAPPGPPQPWAPWNAGGQTWNGWSPPWTGPGGPPVDPSQPWNPSNAWNPWNMWNHASPSPINGITPPRGSEWAAWNNARPRPNGPRHPGSDQGSQGDGHGWTSWNSLNDWSSWAARFSSGSGSLFLGVGNYIVICITGALILWAQRR